MSKGGELLHRGLPDEFATHFMSCEQVTGKNAGDLSIFIERTFNRKLGPTRRRCPEVLPQRIAVGDTNVDEGHDVFCAVIAHDGLEAAHAGIML